MNFLANIYYVLRGTPLWVWILFCWLLYRGISALKPRIVTLQTLFIMPIIFVGLGIQGLLKSSSVYPSLLWTSMLAIGAILGWIIMRGTIKIPRVNNNFLRNSDTKKMLTKFLKITTKLHLL